MMNSAEHHGAGKADAPRTQTLPTPGEHGSSAVQVHDFCPDRLDNGRTVMSIVLAALGAFVFTLVSWLVLKQTSLPAFGSSMVTRALASATIVVVLVLAAAVGAVAVLVSGP